LSEFQSPSRRIFIGSHSLPPSLVALSVLQKKKKKKKKKRKKKKKNLGKYLNDLCVTILSLKDDFCGMARSSSSKRSQKDA
jgi:hypothetical protein